MSRTVFLIIDCEEEQSGEVVAVSDSFALAKQFVDWYNEHRDPLLPKKTLIIERHSINGFLDVMQGE